MNTSNLNNSKAQSTTQPEKQNSGEDDWKHRAQVSMASMKNSEANAWKYRTITTKNKCVQNYIESKGTNKG